MKRLGRYHVIEELGRGSTGVVYKAFDPAIGRFAAIKSVEVGSSSIKERPRALQMFMRELHAAGRLSHPCIVTIHDTFEDPDTQTGCIVMEFVPGRTLQNLLKQAQALETPRALQIISQVAEGLDHAHRQNVVHRDLKPANILLSDDGQVKITDFGIAKFLGRSGTVVTKSVLGTPAYMAPEQVTGGNVNTRSDLFSLGVIFYEMLTGQKPFFGDSAEVLFKIVYEKPAPPIQLTPQLDPWLEYVVLRCLEKDSAKRYSSAREFLDDLDDIRVGRAPRSRPRPADAEPRDTDRTLLGSQPLTAGPSLPGLEWLRERRRGIAVGGACLLLIVVTLGLWRWKSHHGAARQQGGLPRASAPAELNSSIASNPPAPSPGSQAKEQGGAGAQESGFGRPAQLPSGSIKPALGEPPSAKLGQSVQGSSIEARPEAHAATDSAARPGAGTGTVHATRSRPLGSGATPGASHSAKRELRLICDYHLKEASLTISSGDTTIFSGNLKGNKRKLRFPMMTGAYRGTLSHMTTLPADARQLSVHVVSSEDDVDLTQMIAAASGGASATLHIVVSRDSLRVHWDRPAGRKP